MSSTPLTIEQAAARKGCSVSTIWRAVHHGKLHAWRYFGRTVVDAGEVDALKLSTQRDGTPAPNEQVPEETAAAK
jgi:excisionase family DNA binding protein